MTDDVAGLIGQIDRLSTRLDVAQHTIARQAEQLRELQIPCPKCEGYGFIYDSVCDCTGGYIGYATPEMVLRAESTLREIVDLGKDSHLAFDGERWREMWKVACAYFEGWRMED